MDKVQVVGTSITEKLTSISRGSIKCNFIEFRTIIGELIIQGSQFYRNLVKASITH